MLYGMHVLLFFLSMGRRLMWFTLIVMRMSSTVTKKITGQDRCNLDFTYEVFRSADPSARDLLYVCGHVYVNIGISL